VINSFHRPVEPPKPKPLLKQESTSWKGEVFVNPPPNFLDMAPRRSLTAPVEQRQMAMGGLLRDPIRPTAAFEQSSGRKNTSPGKSVRILLPDDAPSEFGSSSAPSSNPSTRSTLSSNRSIHSINMDKDSLGLELADTVFTRAFSGARRRNVESALALECVNALDTVVSRIRHEEPGVLFDFCEGLISAIGESRSGELRSLLDGAGGRVQEPVTGGRYEPWARESAVGSYMYKRWLEKCRQRERNGQ